MRLIGKVVGVLCLMVVSEAVVGQERAQSRGYKPESAFELGEVDSINLFNGGLTLDLPIGGRYQANGTLSYGLSLVYNSNVWDVRKVPFPEEPECTPRGRCTPGYWRKAIPNPVSNAGLGWLLTPGRLFAPYEAAPGGTEYHLLSVFVPEVGGQVGGTVVSAPPGIDCGSQGESCQASYQAGEVVLLQVHPDPGWEFDHWVGAEDCLDGVVTMDVAKNCTALFSEPGPGPGDDTYDLTVDINPSSFPGSGSGRVVSIPGGVDCRMDGGACVAPFARQSTVTLVATPDPGSVLTSWNYACVVDPADPLRASVEMIANTKCIARFDEIDGVGPFDLTVRGGGGVIDVAVDGAYVHSCPADEPECTWAIPGQASVRLSATHPEGLELERWQPSEPCGVIDFPMVGGLHCTALWERRPPGPAALADGEPVNSRAQWMYLSPDGARHLFYDVLQPDEDDFDDTVHYSRDNTYLRLHTAAEVKVLELPDGSSHWFEDAGDGVEYRLRRIEDPFGNFLSLTYATDADGSEVWTLTDSTGRQHAVYLGATPLGAQVERVELAAFGGRRATYRFRYEDRWIDRDCRDNDPTSDPRVRVPLLVEVELPEGGTIDLRDAAGEPRYQLTCAGQLDEPPVPPGKWNLSVRPFGIAGNEGWITSDVGGIDCTLAPNGSVSGICSASFDPGESAFLTAVPMGSSTDFEWAPSSSPDCPDVTGEEGEAIACNARFFCDGPDCGGICTICPSCCECDDEVCFPVGPPVVSEGEPNETGPSGALRGLRLPTGGQIEWDYGTYRLPSRQAPFIPGLAGVTEKRHRDAAGDLVGRWTYTSRPNKQPPYATGDESTWPTATSTDVVTPAGTCSRHYFSGRVRDAGGDGWTYGLPFSPDLPEGSRYLSSQVFSSGESGRCVGAPIRSTSVRYAADAEVVPVAVPGADDDGESRYNTNRRLEDTRTVFHDDGDRWVRTEHTEFNGLGSYGRTVKSGNLAPADRRETITDYRANSPLAPGERWQLRLVDSVEVVEDGARTLEEYDFDPATGFMTCHRRLVGDRRGPRDVLVHFEASANGNTISERWFGGDTQRLGTGAVCSAPELSAYQLEHEYRAGRLSRSEFSGTGVVVLDRDIDAGSGLVSRRRDSAGVSTDLSYDLEGRLLRERPRDGACTLYEYAAAAEGRPARVAVTRSQGPNGCDSEALTAAEIEVDGFGRTVSQRRKMPGLGWVERRTSYNALGWKTAVSVWGGTAATRFESFDPFGRPGSVVLPDDAVISFDYQGERITRRSSRVATGAAGQTLSTTSEVRDSFGRLVSVTEPSGPAGSSQATAYEYDVGGRLSRVTAGQQVRRFEYDARGFLMLRASPEQGVTGFGAVMFGRYDARGLPGRMRDAAGTFDYTYDRAGRLLRVASDGRLLEERVFDLAPGSGGGKLWRAVRHNRVRLPGALESVDLEVVSSYEYRGPDGRPSAKTLTIGDVRFHQTVGYDPLGNVARLDYPVCRGGCEGLAGGVESLRFTYELGLLSGVDDWIDSIQVHPGGRWSRAVHANGVSDLFAVDGRLDRWLRIRTEGVRRNELGGDWDSGEFEYDESGNITRIGVDRFWYDPVQRLRHAEIGQEEESYTYDRYGNLTSVMRNGARRQILVDSATNRLAAPGVAYDERGQLTTFNGLGATLVYDPLGRVKEIRRGDVVARAYLYDAAGERVLAVDDSQGRLYSLRDLDGKPLRIVRQLPDQEWRLELDNVFAGDRLVGFVDGGEAVRHVHLDHLGTPRLHTDESGRVSARHTYLPFGQEITDATQDDFPLKFTGHERDPGDPASRVDDLDYAHDRRFSSWWGRFLSTDSVAGTPARPQSWNRYAYVQNQPVSFRDPTGAYREDFHGEITEVVSLAAGYSPSMARAIAAATVAVDDWATSPFRPGKQKLFHFTSIERRLALLEGARGGEVSAIGALLHAVQDSYSHAGVRGGWSHPLGHTGRSIQSWLGRGADPDSTQDDPQRALAAARMTYSVLRQIGGAGGLGLGTSFHRIQPSLRVALSSTGSRRLAAMAQMRQMIAAERARRLRRAMIGLSLLRF